MAITGDFRYAGFWWRVLAILIDFIILFVAGTIVSFIIGFALGANGVSPTGAQGIVAILSILWTWLYFALLESSDWQATIGKRVCGLIVVKDNGDRITFGRATGRYFAKIISGIILYIGFMMAGWTQRKQALHDKIAGTLVLKEVPVLSHVQTPVVESAHPIRIVQQ